MLASLSFLGLGGSRPSPEWGAMVADGQTFLLTAWWVSTMPGLVIVLVGVGFSLIGDGIADRFGQGFRGRAGRERGDDPRGRRGGAVTCDDRAAATPARGARPLRPPSRRARRRCSPPPASSFSLGAGETNGLVGESGSGKSVTLRSLLGLVPEPGA